MGENTPMTIPHISVILFPLTLLSLIIILFLSIQVFYFGHRLWGYLTLVLFTMHVSASAVLLYYTGFYFLGGVLSFSVTAKTYTLGSICLFIMLLFTWTLFVTRTLVYRDDLILISAVSIFSFVIFFFNDFICIFVILEIITVIFYVLASLHTNYSTEASLKYALFSLFSSALLLFSVLLIYADIGILNIVCWRTCDFSFLGELGLTLLAISILFKAGSFPFHNWALDVYMRSSDFAFFLYSVYAKFFIAALFVNIFAYVPLPANAYYIIYLMGVGNFIIGIIGAFYDRKVRNFIAYTGLVSYGYFLFGYAVGLDGWLISLFYLFAYSVTLSFFFFVLYSFSSATFSGFRRERGLRYILDFAGVLKLDITLSLGLVICLFSFIGIPPSLGFFAKLFILFNVFDSGYAYTTVVMLVLSVLSSFYYLRFVRHIGSHEKHVLFGRKNDLTFCKKVTFVVFLIFQLILIVYFLEITYFFTLLV